MMEVVVHNALCRPREGLGPRAILPVRLLATSLLPAAAPWSSRNTVARAIAYPVPQGVDLGSDFPGLSGDHLPMNWARERNAR
jgi:hypothetical protein